MKSMPQELSDILLLGCEVESIDRTSVVLYVDNMYCSGGFFVRFKQSRRGVKLDYVQGSVVELRRVKDAQIVAEQLFPS